MGGMNFVTCTFSWFLTLGIPPTNYNVVFEHYSYHQSKIGGIPLYKY